MRTASSERRGAPSWWARHERMLHVVVLAGLVWGLAYLTWRIGWTGRGANPVTFVVLVAAEVFGWVSLALFAFMAWRVSDRPQTPAIPRRRVDVFVCTYDEPVEVVEATLVGARAITYPHTTWLLDDGRRAEMARLAERTGVRYVTRPDNAHAKAGNINHALTKTDGELILVLDADHVPLPEILDRTLGAFNDPKVALVQSPHDFYNRDSVQHTRPERHEQTLFYEVIAPGKDRHDSAFWCGSATVIRRAALEDVGGVLTETIAEDFHTTIALHARGWKTNYVRETLVQGLAPHDLDGFLLQRDRWARGNLRVFRTPENPITCRGLSFAQRVSYMGSLVNYFSGPQRLAMIGVLLFTLLSGSLPLHATLVGLGVFWLPWTFFALASTLALGRGTLGFADSTRYGLLTMGIFSRASFTLFGPARGGFKVTPKQGIHAGGLSVLRALPLVSALGVALVVALTLRFLTVLDVRVLAPLGGLALVVTIALGVYELGFVGWVVVPLVRRRQLRERYRFSVQLTGTVGREIVRVVDLTPTGFAIETSGDRNLGELLRLDMRLPMADGMPHDVSLQGEVRSVAAVDHGSHRLGCRVVDATAAARAVLVEYCFVSHMAETIPGRVPSAAPTTAGEQEAVGQG